MRNWCAQCPSTGEAQAALRGILTMGRCALTAVSRHPLVLPQSGCTLQEATARTNVRRPFGVIQAQPCCGSSHGCHSRHEYESKECTSPDRIQIVSVLCCSTITYVNAGQQDGRANGRVRAPSPISAVVQLQQPGSAAGIRCHRA